MSDIKSFVGLLFLCIFIMACSKSQKDRQIVKEEDINAFLSFPSKKSSKEDTLELAFWKRKIASNPRGYLYYQNAARVSIERFDGNADMSLLEHARSYYLEADRILKGHRRAMNKLLLSNVEMKCHNFKAAAKYALDAAELTDEDFGPLMMQFDAEMELGNYKIAKSLLSKGKNMDSFDYLVRLAKLKDREGYLDSAIYYMEYARKITTHKQKWIWATSNLGDMYGHNGEINKSYSEYLKTLKLDSNNHHSIKGIAWIAQSYDKNFHLSKRILEYLADNYANPEYKLLLADAYELLGDFKKSEELKNHFIATAKDPIYYSYLIPVIADSDGQRAVSMALEEVDRRQSPEAFSLLMWAYYKNGQIDDAINLLEAEIAGNTSEPLLLYRMAIIYHSAGLENKASVVLDEVRTSLFELGPLLEKEIISL